MRVELGNNLKAAIAEQLGRLCTTEVQARGPRHISVRLRDVVDISRDHNRFKEFELVIGGDFDWESHPGHLVIDLKG